MTGAAWSSSARALRCSVKSVNERNPRRVLLFHTRLPVLRGRKVRMTSDPHGPYTQGEKRATMPRTKGSQAARRSQSHKPRPSSDWGLQLDPMKSESLVTVNQPRHGECVPGPCTHRPSSHESGEHLKAPDYSGDYGDTHDWG